MSTTEDLPLFLRGNWAPLSEERTLTDLRVTGNILGSAEFLKWGEHEHITDPFVASPRLYCVVERQPRVDVAVGRSV